MVPPPLPQPKNWRRAALLNLFLPGLGLFYLGRRKAGAILVSSFSVCLAAALIIFLAGYIHYLQVVLGSDLMKEGKLEELADVFHKRWLIGFGLAGVALHIVSMLAVSAARRDRRKLASSQLMAGENHLK